MKKNSKGFRRFFDAFSTKITKITGKPQAFLIALAIVIVWGFCGPVFGFSDTWQLVINTSTTIITFLMVFVIQQSQNKDQMALQLKLNELIATNGKASNRLIDSEDLTADELEILKDFYIKLSRSAKREQNLKSTHSIEEAEENTLDKKKVRSSNKKN